MATIDTGTVAVLANQKGPRTEAGRKSTTSDGLETLQCMDCFN
jgi:hypothetical protein